MPAPFSVFDVTTNRWADIQGMPPGGGQSVVPHAVAFQGLLSSISRVYRPSDEALKHSLANARLMVNDPVIEECCEIRRQACVLFDWHIEPGDKNDPRQVEFASELTKMLEAIPRFMQYRENLLRATWYGRYAIGHKWGWKKVGRNMRLIPVQWQPIHGDKIVFRYDDGQMDYRPDQIGIRVGYSASALWKKRFAWEDEQNGEDQDAPWVKNDLLKRVHTDNSRGMMGKIQPTDHGLAYFLDSWERPLIALHKHQIEDGEFEEPTNAGRLHGKGIRSVVYWAWLQKQEALALLMEYLERSAFGFNVFYYPMHNPEAREAIKDSALRQSESGGSRNLLFFPLPQGEDAPYYRVDHIEPGAGGVEALKSIIHEYFGHMIKRYILGQTLTSEAQATGLGSELATIHLGTFMQKLRYDAPNLDETMTDDLLNLIIAYNAPEWVDAGMRFVTDTETPEAKDRLEAMQAAYEMGLKIPAKDLRRLIGVGEPEADEEVLSVVENQKAMQPPQPFGMAAGMEGDVPIDEDAGHVPNAMPIEQEGYSGGPTVSTDRERAIKSSDSRALASEFQKEFQKKGSSQQRVRKASISNVAANMKSRWQQNRLAPKEKFDATFELQHPRDQVGQFAVVAKERISQAESIQADSMIEPGSVETLNPVMDEDKFQSLVDDFSTPDEYGDPMAEKAWKGRPILAIDTGNGYLGLTGSHRTIAARELPDMRIPAITIDVNDLEMEDEENGMTFNESLSMASDDDDRAAILRRAADLNPALEEAALLMEAETSANELEYYGIASGISSDKAIVAELTAALAKEFGRRNGSSRSVAA